MRYVVDTHALLWYFTNDSRLSKKALNVLKEAEQGSHEILVPSIVLLEAIDIADKKRVRFRMEYLFDFLDTRPNFTIVPLDSELLREIARAAQGLELHDRVIATITKTFGGIAVTKDPDIKRVAKILW